jgi:cation diffusion facilitator CzcD-associated flavoprotein CzcO
MAGGEQAAPDTRPRIGNPGDAEYFDVLIVGAGLSGIAAAYHLQTKCPAKTFEILEGRSAIGGTWDLFRYPGVRSDSDMHTLGYPFLPWRDKNPIGDGPSIRKYIAATAHEYGIDRKIRFGHEVARASWSSQDASWTVDAIGPDGKPVKLVCNFLCMCSGYYDYTEGYLPSWPGISQYQGRLVHPQSWPEDLDLEGKRIVVIGSGATAVTVVPALTKTAAHVAMLQRSPTYIVARPSVDVPADWIRRFLPTRLALRVIRWKNILLGMYFYNLSRRRPDRVKHELLRLVREHLGPDYDVEKHFTPRYNPWDQRVCVALDGDLFAAIRSGKASVVTDEIETFTERGILLKSGTELQADVIVTATGLKLKCLGGIQLMLEGTPIDVARHVSYKGVMYRGIPNLSFTLGYSNASWTLKCNLVAEYICRLLNHMSAHGYDYATPVGLEPAMAAESAIRLNSGYIQRGIELLPKQGSTRPWRFHQNYLLDLLDLKLRAVDDGTMEFARVANRPRMVHRANGEPWRP